MGIEIFKYYPDKIRAVSELYYITGDIEDMLETLDLLHKKHLDWRKITFATMNFSGINTNPFEYDDGSAMF